MPAEEIHHPVSPIDFHDRRDQRDQVVANVLHVWTLIHRQPVGIVGMSLRIANFFGIAVPPHGAFAQQPMGRQPRAGQNNRGPPCISGQNER